MKVLSMRRSAVFALFAVVSILALLTGSVAAANEPMIIEISGSPTVTGSGVGAVAVFEDAGWLDADGEGDKDASETEIDLRAEIKSQTGTPTVAFSQTGDDARVRLDGAGFAEIEWSVYEAVSGSGNGATGIQGSGNPTMFVKDIDGPNIEHVGAFFNELTSYSVEAGPPVSDLTKTVTANQVFFDGTNSHSASDTEAMVSFTWTDVSTWRIVYEAESGGRNFDHDGDGDISFISEDIITPTPALAVAKTEDDADNFLDQLDTANYSVTITNNGTGSAFGVDLDDTITGPVGTVDNFTFTDCGSSYSNSSSGLTIDIDDLDVYLDNPCVVTYRITADFAASSGQEIDNTADVSAASNGGNDPAAVNAPTITIDTPPTITNDTLATMSIANEGSYPVSGVCFDDGDSITILLTDSDSPANTAMTTTSCSSGTYSDTVDASSLIDGSISVSSTIDDGYNPTANDTDNITKDATAPTIDQAAAADISVANAATYPVSGTCSADGDAITVTLTDSDSPANTVVAAATCGSGTTGTYSATVNASSLIDGSVNVESSIDDGVNPAVTDDEDVTKDVVVPTVDQAAAADISDANKAVYPVSGTCTTNSDSVDITLTDSDSPANTVSKTVACSGGSYSTTIDASSLDDGSVNVESSIDDGINPSVSDDEDVSKDTVLPTVTQSAAPDINAGNVAAYDVAGVCTANGDSIDITLTDSDSPANTVTTSTTCAAGVYMVTVNASGLIDGSVNVESSIDDGVNPAVTDDEDVAKDVVLPTVTNDALSAVSDASKASYTVTGVCTANGDMVTVTVSDSSNPNVVSAAVACAAGVYSRTLDVTTLNDGSLSVTADITDAVGNTASDIDTTAKDTGLPTISQTNPGNITLANQSAFTVGGVCTNNGDAVSVTITDSDSPANSVTDSTTCAAGIYMVTVNASSLIDGSVTIESEVNDGVNPAVKDSAIATKDTVLPTLTIDTPVTVTGDNLKTYPITGVCTNDGDAVAVTVTDGTTTVMDSATCSGGTFSTTVDLIDMDPGSLDVTATIDDGINPAVVDTDTATMPTDVDDDDTSSAEEKAGPNSGDGNNDGVPDFIQDDVTTKVNPVINAYVTTEIAGDCVELDAVVFEIEPNLATQDDEFDYTIGLHGFEATCGTVGGTVNVTHYWDQEYDTSAWTYRKFLTASNTYIDFNNQVTYGTAVIDGKTVTTVSFSVTDGGPYDADGVANGKIVDPIGPAANVESLSETGSGARLNIVFGALLVTALAIVQKTRSSQALR